MAREQIGSKTKTEISYPGRYNVVFLNDDVTPMEFVIQLLVEIFNKNLEQATDITHNVHNNGRGVAGTYHLEIAEQKHSEAVMISRHNGYPLKIIVEPLEWKK